MRRLWSLAFRDITPEMQGESGGKGATLARLYQKGYPVPDGFIIFPSAFSGDQLSPDAWGEIKRMLERLRRRDGGAGKFAVRSSAASEDSSHASFAGAFETVLNVDTDECIKEAVERVRLSGAGERVVAYAQTKRVTCDNPVSVIVQMMAPSVLSGVLFTADPVTGDCSIMCGDFVQGTGERLVSGDVDGRSFRIKRRGARYEGPKDLKPFARRLFKLAGQLERELGVPQDIEWSAAGDSVYVLQSRPITAQLRSCRDISEGNSSLDGDFLWSNVNFGEAIPDVMTPFTASAVAQGPLARIVRFKGKSSYGVICGRPYLNISVFASVLHALGKNDQQILEMLDGMLALKLPRDVRIPRIAASRAVSFSVLPRMIYFEWKQRKALRGLPALVAVNHARCEDALFKLQRANTGQELAHLWKREISAHVRQIWFGLLASANHYSTHATTLRREMIADVGPEDADALMSGMSSETQLLASLGPAAGLSKIRRGEMSRLEYLERYGHRSPHELELSSARPNEDPAWLDGQLIDYRETTPDVDALIRLQRKRFESAWERFCGRFPDKTEIMQKRIGELAGRARLREEVRSEYVRVFGVWRAWALKAGAMTGLGQDIFYLTLDEVLGLLQGDKDPLRYVPARKETYFQYKSYPQFPAIINGRFDPDRWAADPDRRYDYYDSGVPVPDSPAAAITGVAGSAGYAEGYVRCLSCPEEGDQLRQGEILVAAQTNIGWTLHFAKAAAIITDVGAPLSHAAIVARELGIPAVLGCGHATVRLKTGDRVRVDGSHGVVQVLESGAL